MISVAGNYLLILSMICGLSSFFTARKFRAFFYYISSFLPIIAFLLLIIAFIIPDFSLRNVFFNTSLNKPLIYRVSGSWASHEGSMLLWLAMICLIGLSFSIRARLQQATREILFWLLSFIQVTFASFIFFTSNPFEPFKFLPPEGLGLNPILQDVALSIHPPLLYLGYVSYLIPFVASCLILFSPLEKKYLFKEIKIYSNLALTALTTGIVLGSWWAYRELGWGGFWFFDPVENISLLPWLMGIILHHFLLATTRYGYYERWTIVVSMICFLTTLYGIFFVRSGIISSVHSFAFSPERGKYLFSICLVTTLVGLFIYVLKIRDFRPVNSAISLQYKTIIICIMAGNIFWFTAFLSILIAIIYPIYYSYSFSSDIAIDPEYFQKVFIPLVIPIMLLASIATSMKNQRFQTAIILFIAACVTFAFRCYVDLGNITFCICLASNFLMLQSAIYLWQKSDGFKKSLNISQISLFLGHFGFASLVLGITFNTILSAELKFTGKIGEQIITEQLDVTLHDIRFSESPSYYRQIAEFWIKDNSGNLVILKPENRLYKTEKSISQEVDIFSFLTHDIYVVLSKIDGSVINAEIYYRPLISLIWASGFLISLGFAILLLRKNRL
jgi:cytochrome c-type biogenesis protein CcmF